jgi:hypothetical protein
MNIQRKVDKGTTTSKSYRIVYKRGTKNSLSHPGTKVGFPTCYYYDGDDFFNYTVMRSSLEPLNI